MQADPVFGVAAGSGPHDDRCAPGDADLPHRSDPVHRAPHAETSAAGFRRSQMKTGAGSPPPAQASVASLSDANHPSRRADGPRCHGRHGAGDELLDGDPRFSADGSRLATGGDDDSPAHARDLASARTSMRSWATVSHSRRSPRDPANVLLRRSRPASAGGAGSERIDEAAYDGGDRAWRCRCLLCRSATRCSCCLRQP